MKIVQDANVLIEFFRNPKQKEEFELRSSRPLIFMSSVVALELFAGCRTPRQEKALTNFLKPFEKAGRVVTPDHASFREAGRVLAGLGCDGMGRAHRRQLLNDILIAVTASRAGMVVVTANASDFSLIEKHTRVRGCYRAKLSSGYDSLTAMLVVCLLLTAFNCFSQTAGIFLAAQAGDAAKLQQLLSQPHELKFRGPHGRTALHEAAANCHLEAARLLVESGWDRLAQDDKGRTPAMLARQCADPNVQIVLSRRLTVAPTRAETMEKAAWSLQNASAHGQISVLTMLLGLGADVNAVGSEGHRALDIACLKGDSATARFLLDHGANPNLRNDDGGTPLHDAALSGNAKVVELLLSHGADVNAVDAKGGSTPLHYAASFGRLEAVKLLVEHGADVSRKNLEGLTAVQLALRSAQSDVSRFLTTPVR